MTGPLMERLGLVDSPIIIKQKNMAVKIEWEKMDSPHGHTMFRASIPGGWLVIVSNEVSTMIPQSDSFINEQGFEWRESITFVPDPMHVWL